jgi:hypothetical protein
MKRISAGMWWAIFLVLAGIFLLLKNLGVFRQWGDAAWGALFVAGGLGFLIWYISDLQRWWRSIAGFTLLTSGIVILLQWRQVDLGDWNTALLLLGVALGFWAVLAAHSEMWWAAIPAGVLTVLGLLTGLQARLTEAVMLAGFFLGLGLVFGLLYLMRAAQRDTRWAAIPAAALLLLGLVTLVNALNPAAVIAQWWPALLVIGGVGLIVLSLVRRTRAEPATSAPESREAIRPAPGTSVSEALPKAAPLPAAPVVKQTLPPEPKPAATVAPQEGEIDIYSLLAQQPPDPGSTSAPTASGSGTPSDPGKG